MPDTVAAAVELAVSVETGVCVRVVEPVWVPVRVALWEGCGVTDNDELSVAEALGDAETEEETLCVTAAVPLGVLVPEADAVGDTLDVPLPVRVTEATREGVRVPLAVREKDCEGVAVAGMVALTLAELDDESEVEGVELDVVVGVGDRLADVVAVDVGGRYALLYGAGTTP